MAAVAAFGMVLTSSANAAAGYDMNKVTSPSGSVLGVCTFLSDVPDQSFANMTIALKYEVSADSAALAVNGICTIRDGNNRSYGSVTAGAPGSFAAGAGTVVVPHNIAGPKACNTPEALWLDGTEANPGNLTTCTPL